jgi:hypothetical protein
VSHIAKGAATRAEIAQYHERGRAMTKTFGQVWAGSFLANAVQLIFTKNALDLTHLLRVA